MWFQRICSSAISTKFLFQCAFLLLYTQIYIHILSSISKRIHANNAKLFYICSRNEKIVSANIFWMRRIYLSIWAEIESNVENSRWHLLDMWYSDARTKKHIVFKLTWIAHITDIDIESTEIYRRICFSLYFFSVNNVLFRNWIYVEFNAKRECKCDRLNHWTRKQW